MERRVENAIRPATSGQYAGHWIGNRQASWWPKILNEVHQEDETSLQVPEDQVQSFDVVWVKYINLDSIKFVLFTKLQSSTSQRQTKITCKIDTGAGSNAMPLKMFKSLL